MENNEYELLFSDLTMLEADGEYQDVNRIMTSEFPYSHDWMLRTQATLYTEQGVAEMWLNFYHDEKIVITDYTPSQKDIYFNADLNALMFWAQNAGWKIPQPHPDLVKGGLPFWKHFWDANIVDSDYLNKLYRKRENVDKE